MGLGHPDYHLAEDGLIPCGLSRYIAAHGPGGVPEGGGNSGVDRIRSDSPGVIYGTTQLDNVVQDTEC
jgi:hypothetical protein